MRTIITTDVHGCHSELVDLLKLVDIQLGENGNDRLIVAGDFVDRGPESRAVVRLIRKLQEWHGTDRVLAVLGNHDDKYVRYHKHMKRKEQDKSYKVPMTLSEEKTGIYQSLGTEDLDWLSKLPSSLWFEAQNSRWLTVHAGILPVIPVERQDPRVFRHVRYVNPSAPTKMLSLSGNGAQPEGSVYWTEITEPTDFKVVYGHAVHSLTDPRVDKNTFYGIDTGCVFGGMLTGMILDDAETEPRFVQVKAYKQYAEPRWASEGE